MKLLWHIYDNRLVLALLAELGVLIYICNSL